MDDLYDVPVIVDHVQRGIESLREQLCREAPVAEAMIAPVLHEIQLLENLAFAVATATRVDLAQGTVLDREGRDVNQPRLGFNDDFYRRMIRARGIANRSSGSVDDVCSIVATVADVPLSDVEWFYVPDMTQIIQFQSTNPLTAAQASFLVDIIDEASDGAVTTYIYEVPKGVGYTFDENRDNGLGLDQGLFSRLLVRQ